MKEVSKGFAGRPLFEQANLHVRFQERKTIVGRNGTGKTTLLKLLLEEINPTLVKFELVVVSKLVIYHSIRMEM